MQLEFNKNSKELTIKDEVPTHTWLIIVLMLVNGINMGVQLFLMSYQNNEFLYILMFLLALISVIVILFFLLKDLGNQNIRLKILKDLKLELFLEESEFF